MNDMLCIRTVMLLNDLVLSHTRIKSNIYGKCWKKYIEI